MIVVTLYAIVRLIQRHFATHLKLLAWPLSRSPQSRVAPQRRWST
jgi:hypothetical protein